MTMTPVAAFAQEAIMNNPTQQADTYYMTFSEFLLTVELPIMFLSSFFASAVTFILFGAYRTYSKFVKQFN
jgi:ABC-type multidrug transport system permease subunit